jgi:YHS domain-containing protein
MKPACLKNTKSDENNMPVPSDHKKISYLQMKTYTWLFLVSAALLGSCAGGSDNRMEGGKGISITPDKLSVKLDPVCQMSMDQHPITDTVSYKGQLYGFCSSGCKEAFVAEPEKYLAELPK